MDLYCTDPAQHLSTAAWDLDGLDRELLDVYSLLLSFALFCRTNTRVFPQTNALCALRSGAERTVGAQKRSILFVSDLWSFVSPSAARPTTPHEISNEKLK